MGKLVNFCAGAEWKKRPDNVKAILINAPVNGSSKRRIEKAKLLRQDTQPNYLMVDSGGFQLLDAEKKKWKITHDPARPLIYRPQEINLAAKHVFEFASLLKPDIGFGLDFPVDKFKTAAEREIEFFKKLPLNLRFAHESARWKRKLCPEIQLFQPIQAYNLRHLDIFLDQTAGIPYDGVAIPIREAKFYEIAIFLTSFYQRGISQIHLLGTASFLKIAMVAFMTHDLFNWVSLDSATWVKSAVRCVFLNPRNLKQIDLRRTVKLDPGMVNDCKCSYCCSRSFIKIQNLPNKEKFEMLRQHNWHAIDNAVADLWANSSNLPQLERFLKHRDIKSAEIDNLINTLALVDCLKDDNIEVLHDILTPVPKKRKSSRRSRKQTIFDLQPRKPTKKSRQPSVSAFRLTAVPDMQVKLEQIKKVLQED